MVDKIVAPQLGILHVVVVEPGTDTARPDLCAVGDEGHRMGRGIVDRLPRGNRGIVVAQGRPPCRAGRVEDAGTLQRGLESLPVGDRRAVGVDGRRGGDEGVLASPLVEEAERSHVVNRRRGGPHVTVEELILGRGTAHKVHRRIVRHPDVPAPDELLRAVEQGEDRIAPQCGGLEADAFRGGVQRHVRDQPLGRRPQPVGAPVRTDGNRRLEMLALLVVVGADAVAAHVGGKGVDARRRHHVAVGRPGGTQIGRVGSRRAEVLRGQVAARIGIGHIGAEPVFGVGHQPRELYGHLLGGLHLRELRRVLGLGTDAGPEQLLRIGRLHPHLGPFGRRRDVTHDKRRQAQRLEIVRYRLAGHTLVVLGPGQQRIGRAGLELADRELHRRRGFARDPGRLGRCLAAQHAAVEHTHGIRRIQRKTHRPLGGRHLRNRDGSRKRLRRFGLRLAARSRKQGRQRGRKKHQDFLHIPVQLKG